MNSKSRPRQSPRDLESLLRTEAHKELTLHLSSLVADAEARLARKNYDQRDSDYDRGKISGLKESARKIEEWLTQQKNG